MTRPQRKNRYGKYIGRVSFGTGAQRVQRMTLHTTRKHAEQWEREQREEFGSGYGLSSKVTVGELCARWLGLQELRVPDALRERTFLGYRYYVQALPESFTAVRADRPRDVEAAVIALTQHYKGRGWDGSLRSADRHALDVLRIVFHWAAGPGHLLARNPLTDLPLPRANHPREDLPAQWKDEESQRLFRVELRKLPVTYRNVVLMGLYHAPRVGEILGLEWPQVDFSVEHPTMQIVQAISRYKGIGQAAETWHFGPPKSREHPIPIDPEIVTGLLEIQDLQRAAKRTLGRAYGVPGHPGRDLVFCFADGRPIDRRTFLRRQFQPLCDRAGIPRIRFHQLRNVAATDALAHGLSPKDVADLLGHSTSKMVMDVYAKRVPDAQRRAMLERADRIRGRAWDPAVGETE